MIVIAISLCAASAAQPATKVETPPLAALLPGSTVAAMHLAGTSSLGELWQELLAANDPAAVAPTIDKLARLMGNELSGRTYSASGGLNDIKSQFREELAADCPEVASALEGLATGLDASLSWGNAVVGVTLARYNPLPGVVAVIRPADAAAWADVYQALVYCHASDASINQDGVALNVFADGSDQPLVGATVNGDLLFATSVDLARAMVRLANGAKEPNHLASPIGLVAGERMNDSVGLTLDLGALAAALQGLAGRLPSVASGVPVDKLLASLRTVSGIAAGANFDDGGLIVNSVVLVDDRYGETELAELLLPPSRRVAAPHLVPAGAATLAAGSFSLNAVVDWIDSWLVVVSPQLGEITDVRSALRSSIGLELDSALLDWLGDSWQVAQLDVPSTDLVPYLLGLPGVWILPVSSEPAARVGLAELREFAERALNEAELEVGWSDVVAVTQAVHRGVNFERWRVGPLTDFGVAIIDRQLIVANPAATMAKVIDVHLGADAVLADSRLGGLIPGNVAGLVGYELVDVPRYLLGLAELSDLLAAPMATGLRAAAREAVSSSRSSGVDVADLPTFAELVGLGDFVTATLRTLAGKTGVMVGSSEVVGSALWSTYRLPLK